MSNEDEIKSYLRHLEESESGNNSDIVPHGQRKCPICGNNMVEEMTNLVLYDICPDHGTWLDNGVLAKLLARIKSIDGIEKRKANESSRRSSSGFAGMLMTNFLFNDLNCGGFSDGE